MCGRYALAVEHEKLRVRFGFVHDPVARISSRYNIAPGQDNPVVMNSGERELRIMRWGLIPHWAKDRKIGYKMFNARAEMAAEKPSFRDSFKRRRCLIPATGFFEWKPIPHVKSKQPMFITLKDQGVFAFAGLWSSWHDPGTNNEVLSYAILTQEPNAFMKSLHHRMPVILKPEHEECWLNPSAEPTELKELLDPYPSEQMAVTKVSTLVNNSLLDSPDCISPV